MTKLSKASLANMARPRGLNFEIDIETFEKDTQEKALMRVQTIINQLRQATPPSVPSIDGFRDKGTFEPSLMHDIIEGKKYAEIRFDHYYFFNF